jgi:hypothetical protein
MLSAVLYKAGFLWRRLVTQTVLRPMFAGLGARTTLYPFTLLLGARHIRIGSRTLIRRGSRLEVVDHGQTWTPRLVMAIMSISSRMCISSATTAF